MTEPQHKFNVGQVVYFYRDGGICKALVQAAFFNTQSGYVFYGIDMDDVEVSFDNILLSDLSGFEVDGAVYIEDEVFVDYRAAQSNLAQTLCPDEEPLHYDVGSVVFVKMLYGICQLKVQGVLFVGKTVRYSFNIQRNEWADPASVFATYALVPGAPTLVPCIEDAAPTQESLV